MLERAADADAAHEALSEVLSPSWRQEPITQASALRMLSVLVGTLTKRKADDEHMATKPAACADLFNPATSGGWRRHRSVELGQRSSRNSGSRGQEAHFHVDFRADAERAARSHEARTRKDCLACGVD